MLEESLQLFERLNALPDSVAAETRDRARRVVTQLGAQFIDADGATPDAKREVSQELQTLLSSEPDWAADGLRRANRECFIAVESILADLAQPFSYVAGKYPNLGAEAKTAEDSLLTCLQVFLWKLFELLGPGGTDEALFYRDFVWFFECFDSNGYLNAGYWIEHIKSLSRSPASEAGLEFPVVELLAEYDRDVGGKAADACRSMIFRLANAFVKADGSVSPEEQRVLGQIKDLLYPPVAVVAGATEPPP